MNNALIILIVALGCYVWMQSGWISDLADRANKAEAMIEALELQRENDKRFDDIDAGLRHGGDEGLSDYLRGAAGKLWPTP